MKVAFAPRPWYRGRRAAGHRCRSGVHGRRPRGGDARLPDVTRCFEETLDERGERAGWVRVHGSWVPRHFFGIFHALLANMRCLWATCALLLHDPDCQVVVVDQVSSPIVLLRLLMSNAAVLFYCHFPDLLLATKASSPLRRLYRAPVNFLEEFSTGLAHGVVVNSGSPRTSSPRRSRRCTGKARTRRWCIRRWPWPPRHPRASANPRRRTRPSCSCPLTGSSARRTWSWRCARSRSSSRKGRDLGRRVAV